METIEERLTRLETKIDATYTAAEKARKYVLMMLIATLAMFVLPIILGAVMLPFLLSTVGSVYPI